MSWNVENFFSPDAGQTAAYQEKVAQLVQVIAGEVPDLVALQEVGDPESFEALRAALGPDWTGVLSTHFAPAHAIRVGWLSRGDLTDVEEVVDLPEALSPVKVADDGTTITQLGRGALAVTYTTAGGTPVRVLTAHLKSKLLEFPGGRFDTDDKTERARYTATRAAGQGPAPDGGQATDRPLTARLGRAPEWVAETARARPGGPENWRVSRFGVGSAWVSG